MAKLTAKNVSALCDAHSDLQDRHAKLVQEVRELIVFVEYVTDLESHADSLADAGFDFAHVKALRAASRKAREILVPSQV